MRVIMGGLGFRVLLGLDSWAQFVNKGHYKGSTIHTSRLKAVRYKVL